MERRIFKYLTQFSVTLLAAMLISMGLVFPENLKCNPNTSVEYEERIDADNACAGALLAEDFMTSHGFKGDVDLAIYVVNHIATELPATFLAKFDKETNRIETLSMKACRELENNTIFGLEMDKIWHRSLIVHEVAHAIASATYGNRQVPVVAQEYVAYAAQLHTLPLEYREQAFASYPAVTAFNTDEEFSALLYYMSPDIFAIKVYKHFIRPENGKHFFRRIIDGTFNPDDKS